MSKLFNDLIEARDHLKVGGDILQAKRLLNEVIAELSCFICHDELDIGDEVEEHMDRFVHKECKEKYKTRFNYQKETNKTWEMIDADRKTRAYA